MTHLMRIPRATEPETKAGFGGERREGKENSMTWRLPFLSFDVLDSVVMRGSCCSIEGIIAVFLEVLPSEMLALALPRCS